MIKKYFLLTMIFVMASGCAMNRDMARIEERLQKIERSARDQESDRSTVQDSTEEMRSKIAEMRLDMNQLHETVNQLNGRFEEADYLSKNQNDSGQTAPQELQSMKESVDGMMARMARIEQYLGFENTLTPLPPSAPPTVKGAEPLSPVEPTVQVEDKKLSEKEIYTAAKNEFDKGNTEAAREGFQAYLKKYPKSNNADNAQFWIGEIYYREKWYEKSILEYQKVIEKYPKGNKVPAAYLKQAYAFQNMGEPGNAKLLLKELISKYPDSAEAKIASGKIKELN
jgi:tol-pal system protein YbgF